LTARQTPVGGTPLVTATTLIVASTLCFSLMHALVRHLGAVEGVHAFVIAFWRCLIGGGLLMAWALVRGNPVPSGGAVGMIAARSILNVAAMLCFFAALSLTELATTTALGFTAPLFATLGAWLFLGERLRMRRLGALAVGFIGVIVVLRPGLGGATLGPLLALGSSLMWAVALLMIKRLTDTIDSVSIAAYSGLSMAAMALVPTLFVWQWPTLEQWGWLLLTSVVASGAQLTLTEAFRRAEASAVMPFDFLKLIWASAIGFLWFAEMPSVAAWIGGAVIFASTVYIARRERQLRQSGG
jgi:drug/metabolite transporter (DMT)-like permease